jgi:hypothetical protein
MALLVSVTFGCRTFEERARTEMQPAYRSAKLMAERLKAGADFKEFNTLRGNFATDLSIVRDRMNAGISAKDPLRKYYAAYQDVLGLYSFAARAWEYEISMDECTGPPLDLPDRSKFDDTMAYYTALERGFKRDKVCVDKYFKAYKVISQEAESRGISCPEPVKRLGCILKNAEAKLTSAEALLLNPF